MRGKNGISEGFLQGGNFGGELGAVVLPDHGFGNDDVFGKGTVAIDAQNLCLGAHMGLACTALKTVATGDVAFGRDVVAYAYLFDQFACFDYCTGKFVAQREGWFDAVVAPIVPFVNVQVCATNAGGFYTHQYIVWAGLWNGYIFDNQTGFGFGFTDGFHGVGHMLSFGDKLWAAYGGIF